jgi:DNA recombination protein RmuC
MEGRVLPSARKFKELGAAAGQEIPELEPVDEVPRMLEAAEKEGKEQESGARSQESEGGS